MSIGSPDHININPAVINDGLAAIDQQLRAFIAGTELAESAYGRLGADSSGISVSSALDAQAAAASSRQETIGNIGALKMAAANALARVQGDDARYAAKMGIG